MEGGGGPVLEALGLHRITVEIPCSTCDHAIEDHSVEGAHGRGCIGKAKSRSGEEFDCPCVEFAGGWPNGRPRMLSLRQPNPVEWMSIGSGEGVPLVDLRAEARGVLSEETWNWFRAIVEKSLVAVLVVDESGRERWQETRVLPVGVNPPPGIWSVSMDDLDRAGFVGHAALAVISDANAGAPFCGWFRGRIAPDEGARTRDVPEARPVVGTPAP